MGYFNNNNISIKTDGGYTKSNVDVSSNKNNSSDNIVFEIENYVDIVNSKLPFAINEVDEIGRILNGISSSAESILWDSSYSELFTDLSDFHAELLSDCIYIKNKLIKLKDSMVLLDPTFEDALAYYELGGKIVVDNNNDNNENFDIFNNLNLTEMTKEQELEEKKQWLDNYESVINPLKDKLNILKPLMGEYNYRFNNLAGLIKFLPGEKYPTPEELKNNIDKYSTTRDILEQQKVIKEYEKLYNKSFYEYMKEKVGTLFDLDEMVRKIYNDQDLKIWTREEYKSLFEQNGLLHYKYSEYEFNEIYDKYVKDCYDNWINNNGGIIYFEINKMLQNDIATLSSQVYIYTQEIKALEFEIKYPLDSSYDGTDWNPYKYIDVNDMRNTFLYMNKQQKENYAKYYKQYGKKVADEYLVSIEDSINQSKGEALAKREIERATNKDGSLDLTKIFGDGLDAGFESFCEGIVNVFTADGVKTDGTYQQMYYMQYLVNSSGMFLQEIYDKKISSMNEEKSKMFETEFSKNCTNADGALNLDYIKTILTKEEYDSFLRKQKNDKNNFNTWVYEFGVTSGNMLPSMAVGVTLSLVSKTAGVAWLATAGNVLSNAMMGLSTYGNSKNDALIKGHALNTARWYGVCSSLSEVGLGLMLGNIPGLNADAKFCLKGIFSEGLEEMIQEYVGAGLNAVILNESVDFEELNGQALKSFIFGALMSGVSTGIVSGIEATTLGVAAKINGQNINVDLNNISSLFKQLNNEKVVYKKNDKTGQFSFYIPNDADIDIDVIKQAFPDSPIMVTDSNGTSLFMTFKDKIVNYGKSALSTVLSLVNFNKSNNNFPKNVDVNTENFVKTVSTNFGDLNLFMSNKSNNGDCTYSLVDNDGNYVGQVSITQGESKGIVNINYNIESNYKEHGYEHKLLDPKQIESLYGSFNTIILDGKSIDSSIVESMEYVKDKDGKYIFGDELNKEIDIDKLMNCSFNELPNLIKSSYSKDVFNFYKEISKSNYLDREKLINLLNKVQECNNKKDINEILNVYKQDSKLINNLVEYNFSFKNGNLKRYMAIFGSGLLNSNIEEVMNLDIEHDNLKPFLPYLKNNETLFKTILDNQFDIKNYGIENISSEMILNHMDEYFYVINKFKGYSNDEKLKLLDYDMVTLEKTNKCLTSLNTKSFDNYQDKIIIKDFLINNLNYLDNFIELIKNSEHKFDTIKFFENTVDLSINNDFVEFLLNSNIDLSYQKEFIRKICFDSSLIIHMEGMLKNRENNIINYNEQVNDYLNMFKNLSECNSNKELLEFYNLFKNSNIMDDATMKEQIIIEYNKHLDKLLTKNEIIENNDKVSAHEELFVSKQYEGKSGTIKIYDLHNVPFIGLTHAIVHKYDTGVEDVFKERNEFIPNLSQNPHLWTGNPEHGTNYISMSLNSDNGMGLFGIPTVLLGFNSLFDDQIKYTKKGDAGTSMDPGTVVSNTLELGSPDNLLYHQGDVSSNMHPIYNEVISSRDGVLPNYLLVASKENAAGIPLLIDVVKEWALYYNIPIYSIDCDSYFNERYEVYNSKINELKESFSFPTDEQIQELLDLRLNAYQYTDSKAESFSNVLKDILDSYNKEWTDDNVKELKELVNKYYFNSPGELTTLNQFIDEKKASYDNDSFMEENAFEDEVANMDEEFDFKTVVNEYKAIVSSTLNNGLENYIDLIIENRMNYIQQLINEGNVIGDVNVYDVLTMLVDGVEPKNIVDSSILGEWDLKMNSIVESLKKYAYECLETTGIGTSGKGLRKSEININALKYLQEDSNAVFGYKIVGNARFENFDFSNESEVMKNREIRIKYLLEDEAIQNEVLRLQKQGYSSKQLAEYAVNTRNQNKVSARGEMELSEHIGVAIGNIVTYGTDLDKVNKGKMISQLKKLTYNDIVSILEQLGVTSPTNEMVYNKAIEIASNKLGISFEKGIVTAIGPDLEWLFKKQKNKLGLNVSDDDIYWSIIKGASNANQELNAVLGLKQ